MNIKRGLVRLAVVFLLPWSAFWGWTYYDARQRVAETQEMYEMTAGSWARRAIGDNPKVLEKAMADEQVELDEIAEWQQQALDRAEMALFVGIMGVAICMLVLGGGYWAWRGFKPNGTPA